MNDGTIQRNSIISVDVEDYFQVQAFSSVVRRDEWSDYPSRVEKNTRRVMDLLDERGIKGTFFILGWVADKHPQIVREIVNRGHEPACHSYWHRLVYTITPDEFRRDTIRAKNCIEQTAGQPVLGYRAPCFSITDRSLWAIEILSELGFRYDSSIFPIKHEWYGIAGAPRTPFQISTRSGLLTEYPITTFRFGRVPNFPVAGGGYLRLLPFFYTKTGIRRAWEEGLTVVAYIHPWELDPEQPRISASLKSRIRHYTNLQKTQERLCSILDMGKFHAFCHSELLNEVPLWSSSSKAEVPVSAVLSGLDIAKA